MPKGTLSNPALAQELLDAFDAVFGLHQGHRPAHAKGLLCTGTFTPSPDAAKLTRAPHASRKTTPVTVRYSDGSGLPAIPDNDPHSTPKGMAVRFHLGEHVHTDVIAHSTDFFPVRTGEEFLEFFHGIAAAGAGRPEVLGTFLAAHPNAKRFVEAPKPIPTSFAREAFFAVTSFQFTNADGTSRHGRFRIRPDAGTEYLSSDAAAAKPGDFLFDEIHQRLARGPIALSVFVQLAGKADDVTNSTVSWPNDREEVLFGKITLTKRVDDETPELRNIIFDPLPRIDGIDSSGDPLTQVRADLYLLSGRRRRAATPLPKPVDEYFAATNAHDVASMMAAFEEGAVVKDEGHEHRGLAEIRSWMEETIQKYDYQVRPTEVTESDGETVVTGEVSGKFPGSPVRLRHTFTLDHEKISRLEIG
jgi:catalase